MVDSGNTKPALSAVSHLPAAVTPRALTNKQEAFVIAYLRLTNATEAYRIAYNTGKMTAKSVNETASRLLKNSKVAARLAELAKPAAEQAQMTVDRTVRETGRVAFLDPARLYGPDGLLKSIPDMDEDTRAAIASFEVEEIRVNGDVIGRTKKVKLWDKNSALDKAMRYHGLFERDNMQKPAPQPVQIQVVLVGGK